MRICVLTAALLLVACGSNDPLRDAREEAQMQASVEATHAYVEENQLEEVNHFRYQDPLRYEAHNDKFVIVETSAASYLVELRYRCPDLYSRDIYTDMADIRSSQNVVRAGIDTIRGCRIASIYKLPLEAVVQPSPEAAGDENEQE